MKKLIRSSLLILFIIVFTSIRVMAMTQEKVILIDPGHGGFDGGAKSKNGVIEKEINLEIALKLKEKLQDKGYKVFLTRENDEALGNSGSTIKEKKREDLKKRRDMKKETNCDVFVSIHQNMFPQEKCYGAQVWYSSNDISVRLANNIQESIKETVKDNNKRVSKPAGDSYLILRDDYKGASVLVECGFLSNMQEEKELQTEEHQNALVEGICLGIERYFEEINNN